MTRTVVVVSVLTLQGPSSLFFTFPTLPRACAGVDAPRNYAGRTTTTLTAQIV